jgi:hypothetical protein
LSGCSRPRLSPVGKSAKPSRVAGPEASRSSRLHATPMSNPLGERNVAACQLVSEVLQLSGSVRIRVLGDSMFPSILPGDTLVVERQEITEMVPGDIVLFARNGRLFAHRMVSQKMRTDHPFVVTCGDSRLDHDAPVFPHEVLGCVTSIARGARRISPRVTRWKKRVSWLGRRSDFLKRCLLWLTCRIHSLRDVTECRT